MTNITISRRSLIGTGIAAGATLTIPSVLRAQTAPSDARTVRMVLGDLTSYDPYLGGADITLFHGSAIYDTLFELDSNLMPQPQMVEKWGLSDDKKTYTFDLRDGLSWHDGTPVTAADCVASIRRWFQAGTSGKLMSDRTQDISRKGDKTFTIALKEPLPLLIDLMAKVSHTRLLIMREKDANRPVTEQVTANIGSGPFKFNHALATPGVSVTYDRNENYVPRSDPSNGLAGAKIVNIDRVIWSNIADDQTAFAALQAGEIDLWRFVPADLYPAIESDPNLALQALDAAGEDFCFRLNHMQKPFDNVKARQALLHLIDQEAFMRVIAPDLKYAHTVTSIFGNSTAYSNDENTGWFKKGGDPEKAQQLFKESGYSGEPVVILQPTDWAPGSNSSQLLAATLRKIGVNAELAPSDWAALVARAQNPKDGWSVFPTSSSDFTLGDPLGHIYLGANGDKAWNGWPKSDAYEALRAKWADVETLEERKALARKMQSAWWDFVGDVRYGQVIAPYARRKTLTGLIEIPQLMVMWNMEKTTA